MRIVWMGRVSELQLPLAAITQSWVKPVVDAKPR
jgi:hypothetical protein